MLFLRSFLFVPGTGIEPAHSCERQILSLLRLPIPPPGRAANNEYRTGNIECRNSLRGAILQYSTQLGGKSTIKILRIAVTYSSSFWGRLVSTPHAIFSGGCS